MQQMLPITDLDHAADAKAWNGLEHAADATGYRVRVWNTQQMLQLGAGWNMEQMLPGMGLEHAADAIAWSGLQHAADAIRL